MHREKRKLPLFELHLSQVMLINAVKDVTSALGDLMQATKSASGKNMQHPAMITLKDTAKVRLGKTSARIRRSLLKVVTGKSASNFFR